MADEENPQKELPEQVPSPATPQRRFAGPGSVKGTRPEKTSWPELVGLTSEEAQTRIKEEMPGANVQIIPSDHCITMDFRLDRVRIFIDSSGKVQHEPRIG
ncbi:hypothetical protein M9H77_03708 [Catharanthus roseus]|uniref:Uncharacterized protein n=1 Tax=Catharanthus roseus TaxID=4058 RepID=A0ACC0CC65_CATRO|nr:hypothetical protein M9H77_03708 [Catharanthus roseus]